eukprot:7713729-Pyramimonas_sp.AAC.1
MSLFLFMLVYMIAATVAACYLAKRRSRERRPDTAGGEVTEGTDDGLDVTTLRADESGKHRLQPERARTLRSDESGKHRLQL